MNKLVLGAMLLVSFTQAFAVDGYKGLKFGASKDEVMNSGLCSFVYGGKEQGSEYLYCDDLVFSGSEHEGIAYMIDGKLERFGIPQQNLNSVQSLAQALTEKYGDPVVPSEEDLLAIDTLPSRSADIKFDNGTVLLRLLSDENMVQSVMLIYTSKDFESLVMQKIKNNMAGDL